MCGICTVLTMLALLVLPSFAQLESAGGGQVRVIVGRPNHHGYKVEKKTVWIATLVEASLYFRIDAVDRASVVPMEELRALIPVLSDIDRRVSKGRYAKAGKEVNASHVVYAEYEPTSGDMARLHLEVVPTNSADDVVRADIELDLTDMNAGVTDAAGKVFEALGVLPGEWPDDFMSMGVLGSDARKAKRLGELLVEAVGGSAGEHARIARECENMAVSDPDMLLAYYVGAMSHAASGNSAEACALIRGLADRLGGKYPKLYLQLSRYYRREGRFDQALAAIDKVSGSKSLEVAVLWEKALAFDAGGDLTRAREQFSALESRMPDDPVVQRSLAKISLALGRESDGMSYVAAAAQLTGKSQSELMGEIGTEFVQAGDTARAIGVFSGSVDLAPDNAQAWRLLGDLQAGAHMDSAAAESYLVLFFLDILMNRVYLEKAGSLFVKSNMRDRAKEAYSGYLDQQAGDVDITLLLAKLEKQDGNCSRVNEVLQRLDETDKQNEEVQALLLACEASDEAPVITLNGGSPMVIFVGEGFVDPGVMASDKEDGDLSDRIDISGIVNAEEPGTYTLSYTVADAAGNRAAVTRTVKVRPRPRALVDATAPQIVFAQEVPTLIQVGSKFTEPQISAADDVDGDVSAGIVKSGYVDVMTPGNYTIEYSVTDMAGNRGVKELNVTVEGVAAAPVDLAAKIEPVPAPAPELALEPEPEPVPETVFEPEPEPETVFEPEPDHASGPDLVEPEMKPRFREPRIVSRKRVLAWTTGALTLAAVGGGVVMDRLVKQRLDDYRNAGKDDVNAKHDVLAQTVLVRNISYIVGAVGGVGFTVNIAIPSR